MLQDKGDLSLGLWLDERLALYCGIIGNQHGIGQLAEIGFKYPDHLLHHLGRNPDLLTDDCLTGLQPPRNQTFLNAVGIDDIYIRIPVPKIGDRLTGDQGIVKLIAQ